MGKETKRRTPWVARLENLEDRLLMSADPVGDPLGIAIDHHVGDSLDIAIDHHLQSTPDFWIEETDDDLLEQELQQIEQALASAHDQTGLDNVLSDYGFTGEGQTVAVIDSGIAYDHYALGGGYGSDYRVVGGYDFTENDADPYDDGPSGSHGTHVAGIVGADGSTHDGVATGVDLVGLRVFDDAGAGYFSWVEDALQWVHDNRNSFENPITAVNLSLGVSGWNEDTIPSWAMLEDEFAQLEADGIFISVSAGNAFTSYNATGLSYPAASSYVVPVMSVDDDGDLSYFSQRHERAIAAPGRTIVSTVPDYAGNNNGTTDDWASFSGTSMAAPYVAGASVLIREAMEFVGYANVTQDTIYDHMMATADSIYDSITDTWYSSLNLEAAIDALMPTDDFGSTIGTAFNLGTITDTDSVNGLIGTLNDSDYFTFTAGVTGSVSFTASSMTHDLAASWQLDGGSGEATGEQNETFTFDVVAGEAYTLGFSSADGLGYYDFEITAESTFTYIDLGAVSFNQVDDNSIAGEQWYRIQSSEAGYVSVESFFNTSDGQINLHLFDSDMQEIDAGNGINGQARVDTYAAAGEEFFVCMLGNNVDVDLRLSNLVSLNGTTVEVEGTSGDDVFSFTAGSSSHEVVVNGVTYNFAANAISSVEFDGGAGEDSITMTGTSGYEIATISVGGAKVQGAGYSVDAESIEFVEFFGQGGNDRAYLFDSIGDDVFTMSPNSGSVTAEGFEGHVFEVYRIYAYASEGYDSAYLHDSATNDIFWSDPDRAKLYGVGFHNLAEDFERVYAYATQGTDKAYFYDSPENDIFWSDPTRSKLYGLDFHNLAEDFDRTYAYSSEGRDKAHLYDSNNNDVFWSDPSVSKLYGVGFHNRAQGFHRVYAYASGGRDQAIMYGSTSRDHVWSNHTSVKLYGSGYHNLVKGFEQTYTYAGSGSDLALLESASVVDAIYGREDYTVLSYEDSTLYMYDLARVSALDLSGDLNVDVEATDYVFGLISS